MEVGGGVGVAIGATPVGDCCVVVSIVWTSSVSFWSHDCLDVPGVKLGASTSMHGASVEQIVIIIKKKVKCFVVWWWWWW